MRSSNCCDAAIKYDGRCEACREHTETYTNLELVGFTYVRNYVPASMITSQTQWELYQSSMVKVPPEVYDAKELSVHDEFPEAYGSCAGIVSKILARRGQRNSFWNRWYSKDFCTTSTEAWQGQP